MGKKHCLDRDFSREVLNENVLGKWKATRPDRPGATSTPEYKPTILDNWRAFHLFNKAG